MPALITYPEPLSDEHDLSNFSCGENILDQWLRQRAGRNEVSGASRTYVVCADDKVVAYYSLAVGSIEHNFAPGNIKRNMPEPIPVMILGRLAVDTRHRRKNIGTSLVRDALLRTLRIAGEVGVRALLVHALHEQAAGFYQRLGFAQSPFDSLMILLGLKELRQETGKNIMSVPKKI
jgi:GNAT superfamily N-acetyltransferase